MTPEARETIVIQHEGQAMLTVGSYPTRAQAAEVACCVVDGIINAVMRMQGAEETAKFVMALTDRVVSTVRGPTLVPEALKPFAVVPEAPSPASGPAPQPTPEATPSPSKLQRGVAALLILFLLGFLMGLLVGIET